MLLASLPWLSVGCGEADGVQEIPEVRQARESRARVRGPLTEAMRFRSDDPGTTPASADSMGSPEVVFDLPDGWVEKTPTETRQINVSIDSRPDVECYLAILPGRAGGGLNNVNRWRRQMGLDPTDEAGFDALPTATLLGKSGVFVDLEGAFTGMGGPSREGWRMGGMIVESGGMTAFLKMTGPSEDVAAELGSLRTFAESIRIEERAASAGGSRPGAGSATGSGSGMTYDAPESWVKGPAKSMRLVTYYPGGDEAIECYVTMIGGDGGGGFLGNLNRWREQLGAGPLTEDEIAALPTVPMFGADCPVLSVEGDFTPIIATASAKPPEAKPDHALLGAVRVVPMGAILVKMVGPRDLVAAEREHFLAFCESLGF